MHNRLRIRLLLVLAAAACVACGSSPSTPRGAGASAVSVTTPSTVSPTVSAEAGTATVSPASTVGSVLTTTAATTMSGTVSTTTVPPPLPVQGTGVHGRMTAGPMCPVERVDQPCPPGPVHGRVDALDAAGHTAGNATTDEAGRYAISLPPGGYVLRVVKDGPFPRCPDMPVTVAAGPPVTADINCDTGIR